MFRRGDFVLYGTLLSSSVCPKSVSCLHKVYSRSHGMMIVEILLSVFFITAGLSALRAKFMFMHFVSTVSLSHWDLRSIALFLGFVNQISSIFDHDYFEFSRLLIFKF